MIFVEDNQVGAPCLIRWGSERPRHAWCLLFDLLEYHERFQDTLLKTTGYILLDDFEKGNGFSGKADRLIAPTLCPQIGLFFQRLNSFLGKRFFFI